MAAIQKIEDNNLGYQPDKADTRRLNKTAAAVGALSLAVMVGANLARKPAVSTPEQTKSYIVQPGDTVDGIVQKLEHKYGQDTAGYDYQEEEYRLAHDHPVLHPGETLSVPIK